MRFWCVFRKCLREQLRELWLLALVIIMAPFFVFLMSLVFGGGSFDYKVVIVNHDQPAARADGSLYSGGAELAEAIIAAKNPSGAQALRVSQESERATAVRHLVQGKAHALVEIPSGFSRSIVAFRSGEHRPPAELIYMGDIANPSYRVAAVLAITVVANYLELATGQQGPVALVEKPLGASGARSELDVVLPGLFMLGIIMLLFPVAMALARESESGCLRRIQLTRLTALELLGGLSLVQVLVGIVAVVCAFATAWAMGFKSQGPLWVALALCSVASLSVIGVGLVVASFSRSVTEAFLLGNFPMILLMFFSGAMIPIPKVILFSVGSTSVGLWDWMPTTHAVSAMNKILGIGLGLNDVVYELISLILLSALYFAAGVGLFKRRRMVAA